ncbi:uncharacterized protein LOC123311725 [Coccinella septempunctata]|uniref:uncharacterized protein LOC123311725 n=1 Tax=Coccinella septempunctata TaxID=41139 RepID=UPI001D05C38B|nr:uncharacterized protein LOC123311725 [Coccinella septempunctata]
MGFYQDIAARFGHDAVHNMKLWAINNTKLANFRNRRIFLLQCKNNGLIPQHITEGSKCIYGFVDISGHTVQDIEKFNDKLRSKILSLEIKFAERRVAQLERKLKECMGALRNQIPPDVFNEYQARQIRSYNGRFNKVRNVQRSKFDRLIKKHISKLSTKQSWLVNLSGVELPEGVKTMLSLGPKFGVPPHNNQISIKKILSDVEYIISDLSERTRDIIRAQTTNIITNFHFNNIRKPSYLYSLYKETRNFLRSRDDLLVLNSDKGNVSVLMTSVDYFERCDTLVNDGQIYELLNRDPTNQIETKNNKLVKFLKDSKFVDVSEARDLMSYDTVPPRFYGLPKLHKEGIPMRPIVNTIGSPTSKLSKYMANILKKSFSDYMEFSLINSKKFAEEINGFKLPDEYELISLDAVSLFTNISVELVIEIIYQEWDLILPNTEIPKETFIDIIEFIFQSNYFIYKGNFYRQKFGCPMGNSLIPILANMVMSYLLKFTLPRLSFRLPFVRQYMDDLHAFSI